MSAMSTLILGDSGSGKSVSIRNLDPKEVFVILCDGQKLTLPGARSNYKTVYKDGKLDLKNSNMFETVDPGKIVTLMKSISANKPEIKYIVIDTITSVMTDEYLRRFKEKGFDKFGDLALNAYNIIKTTKLLRDDLMVVIMAHTDDQYDANGMLKTVFKVPGGKMVSNTVKPEAYFDLIFYSEVTLEDGEPQYYFLTKSNGKNISRTPFGVFSEPKVPNDLSEIFKVCVEHIK